MKCPKCRHLQKCPCNSCQSRQKAKRPWVNLSDGYSIACGKCGFTAGSDYWLNREHKEYLKFKAKAL